MKTDEIIPPSCLCFSFLENILFWKKETVYPLHSSLLCPKLT